MKKYISVFLVLVMALVTVSCSNRDKDKESDTTTKGEEAVTENIDCDLPEDLLFSGKSFVFAVYENANANNLMIPVDEEDGDLLSSALIQRVSDVEARFDIMVDQRVFLDQLDRFRNPIFSGVAEFDVANVRCIQALTLWQEGLLTDADTLPYIDTEKDYWSKSINDSISINHRNYTLLGDMVISSYDLTYALLFNQTLVADNSLGNLYELVNSGGWTVETMFNMMKTVARDVDSDGEMTENDIYGYIAHSKNVLPNFWIAAGEKSIVKNENDEPVVAMGQERFINVVQRVFEITWDAKTYRKPVDERVADLPIDLINLFVSNQALFMDTSFYYIMQLNGLTSNFGVIPYPKLDSTQSQYYSRLSYYNAPVVPICNTELEKTGALLEYFNYISHKIVIPVYYERILKLNSVPDEETSEMLDFIFKIRVTDIGDTTLCNDIRDAFVYDMFRENDRNLVSKISEAESALSKLFGKQGS